MNDRQRLEAIASVVCRYLPPDGTRLNDAMSEIIGLVDPLPPARDDFLLGVCVALQAVTASGDGVLWTEIVETAGADELFQYAAHIEPAEWELAGFDVFAKEEMNRGKPKKRVKRPAQRNPLQPEWYAQWIRNHYQNYWHINTLCDGMTKAAHTIKEKNK